MWCIDLGGNLYAQNEKFRLATACRPPAYALNTPNVVWLSIRLQSTIDDHRVSIVSGPNSQIQDGVAVACSKQQAAPADTSRVADILRPAWNIVNSKYNRKATQN